MGAFSQGQLSFRGIGTADYLKFLLGFVFLASAYMKGVNLPAFAWMVHNFMGLLDIGIGLEYAVAFTVCVVEAFIGYAAFSGKISVLCLPLYLLVTVGFLWINLRNITHPLGGIESCGCFGELIHLTPLMSLVKSVILFAITVALIAFNRKCNYKAVWQSVSLKEILYVIIPAIIPFLFSALFID